MSDDLNPHTKNVLTDSQKLDTELEFDPVLEEGRASALRVSVYVIAGLATAATRWMWKRSYGGTTKAPPDERGGNRYVLPNVTAPA